MLIVRKVMRLTGTIVGMCLIACLLPAGPAGASGSGDITRGLGPDMDHEEPVKMESPRSSAQRWPTCNQYIFVGMRGSGQKYSTGSAAREMGPQLGSLYGLVYQDPKFRAKTTYMGVAAYQAAPTAASEAYFRQVIQESGTALVDALTEVSKRCPNSKLIVAGYSQGAYAVRSALVRMETDGKYAVVLSRIAAAAVTGDPGAPGTGALYLVQALSQGAFAVLVNLVNGIQRLTGIRIPFFGEIIAVSATATNLNIAGSPRTVPFSSADNPADIVSRGKELADEFVPLWWDVFANSAPLPDSVKRIRELVKSIRNNVRIWGKFHGNSYGRTSKITKDLAAWIVRNSR